MGRKIKRRLDEFGTAMYCSVLKLTGRSISVSGTAEDQH
jgi:hypothetical protein